MACLNSASTAHESKFSNQRFAHHISIVPLHTDAVFWWAGQTDGGFHCKTSAACGEGSGRYKTVAVTTPNPNGQVSHGWHGTMCCPLDGNPCKPEYSLVLCHHLQGQSSVPLSSVLPQAKNCGPFVRPASQHGPDQCLNGSPWVSEHYGGSTCPQDHTADPRHLYVLNGGGKKVFQKGSFAKRSRVAHMFDHGWWRWAVGGWW